MDFAPALARLLVALGLVSAASWITGHPEWVAIAAYPAGLLADVLLGAARGALRRQFSLDQLVRFFLKLASPAGATIFGLLVAYMQARQALGAGNPATMAALVALATACAAAALPLWRDARDKLRALLQVDLASLLAHQPLPPLALDAPATT